MALPGAPAVVKIRVDDPAALPDLIEELSRRVDAVITSVGDHELEVWLLGSLTTDADHAEMEERLRNRRAARHTKVWIVSDEP
jgi:hypothetical protein